MTCLRRISGSAVRHVCVGCVTGVLWISAALVAAETPPAPNSAAIVLPVDEMPATVRERVRQAVQQPTLTAHAPAESFPCDPTVYHWLLDHHDRAALAWRRMGARCVPITDRGDGRFGIG